VDKVSEAHIFRYNEDASVNTLDPAYIKSQSEIWIGSQIFEGLVTLDSNLKVIPQIAKNWEIDTTGTVYKFYLKDDIYFHNRINKSYKLTAYDAAASLLRILNPYTASPGAWILNDKITPNKKFTSKLLNYYNYSIDKTSPILAVDSFTLIIRLNKPSPSFLSLLATNYGFILPKKYCSSGLAEYLYGTGPFYLKRWERDVALVLRKNNAYHEFDDDGIRLPYLDAVHVSFVKNKQTAFMQFMAGEYDFFNGIDASFKDELLTKSGKLQENYSNQLGYRITDFLNTEYIGINLIENIAGVPNPLTDVYLRKALHFSVDKVAMVKYFRNGLGRAGLNGFVPPKLLKDIVEKNTLNLDSAKYYLNKSKYFSKYQGFEIPLTTTADYLDMAVYLQSSWKKLGINIRIDLQTGGMLRQLRNQGKLFLFRGSWIADYPDAENYLSCFYQPYEAPNGPNYTHFNNSKFDSLYKEIAFGVFNNDSLQDVRINLMIEANDILKSEIPVIELYYDKSLRMFQKNIENLNNDPINRLNLKRVKNLH